MSDRPAIPFPHSNRCNKDCLIKKTIIQIFSNYKFFYLKMRTLRRKRHTNANAIANDKNERKRNLAQDDDAETHWALPIIGTIVVILNLLLLLIIIFDIPILSLAFYFFNNLYPNSIKYDGQNDLTGGRNLFFKPNHKYTLPKCKECIDKKQEGWCDITLPTRSYFGFAPPTDKAKWKQAACLAASGDNVLFERIFTEIFPSKNKTSPVEKPSGPGDLSQFAYRDPSIPVDVYGFLDGDLEYHMLQPMVDIFMNKESSFNQLLRRPVGASSNDSFVNNPEGINLNEVISDLMVKLPPDEYEISPEELQRMRATLPPSNLLFKRRKQMSGKHSQNHINKYTGRYPIVSLGYPLLKRVASDLPSRAMSPVSRTLSKFNFDASTRKPGGGLSMSNTHVATETNPSSYYKGEEVGGYYIGRDKAMRMWSLNKDAIEVPFVAIYVNNENWGYLSTGIPGRTKDWEQEDEFFTKTLYEFLDHPMTLALVINQHHNFSHPKIINFPLGLPPIEVAGGVNGISSIVHEVMEEVYGKHEKKNTLVYTAYSRSGDKERIMKCLSKNIRPQEEHVWKESVSEDGSWRHADMSRHEYYKTLAKSRFTIGLPGSVGIDTFR